MASAPGGFSLQRKASLPLLDALYAEHLHGELGTRWLHLACPTSPNAFAVVLPTPCCDASGLPHIVEHLVGWGSARARGKHVFFEMMSRSLQSFLNAFTGPGWTMYTFCSPDVEDFLDLLDVHVESVFFPRFEQGLFEREAWHVEPAPVGAAEARLSGVVLNERRGAYASAETVVEAAVARALYPDTPHAHDHGGHPDEIPSSSLAAAVEFHRRYYHPSHALFYTFGDLPQDAVARRIETQLGAGFARREALRPPVQPRFPAPVRDVFAWPEAPHAAGTQTVVAWAAQPQWDAFERFTFRLLGTALCGEDSPAVRALQASGLGRGPTPRTGVQAVYCQPSCWIGLSHVDPERAGAVEEIVLEAAARLTVTDLSRALDRSELRWRELDTDGLPHPLALLTECLGPALYEADALPFFEFSTFAQRIAQESTRPDFLRAALERCFLDNRNRALVVIDPAAPRARHGRTRTAPSVPPLPPPHIAPSAHAPGADEPELSLPLLDRDKIRRAGRAPFERRVSNAAPAVRWVAMPTGGALYFDLRANLAGAGAAGPLPATEALLYARLLLWGIAHVRPTLDPSVDMGCTVRVEAGPDGGRAVAWGHVHGRVLSRHADHVLAFLGRLAEGDLPWTQADAGALLEHLLGRLSAGLHTYGPKHAWTLAASGFSPVGRSEHLLEGYGFLEFVRRCRAAPAARVRAHLEDAGRRIFRDGATSVAFAGAQAHMEDRCRELAARLGRGVAADPPAAATLPGRPSAALWQALTSSAPVAHNAEVFPAVAYTHPDSPALLALSHYLRIAHLHREIRENGGAYAANALYDPRRGYFALWSYRDPHIAETYRRFERSRHDAAESVPDAERVEQAVLGAVKDEAGADLKNERLRASAFDPDDGYTTAVRRRYLSALVSVGPDDLRRTAAAYLTGDRGFRASFGSAERLREASDRLGASFTVVGHLDPA